MKMLIRVLVAWCLVVLGVYAEEVVVAKDAVIIPDVIGIDTIDKEINTYFVRPCVMELARYMSDLSGASVEEIYLMVRGDEELMGFVVEAVDGLKQGSIFEWNRIFENKSPDERLEVYQEGREACESTIRLQRIRDDQGYD